MSSRALSMFVVACVTVAVASPGVLFAQQEAEAKKLESKQSELPHPQQVDWLRGANETLEMRLRGEVLAADGSPAKTFTLKVVAHSGAMENAIDVKLDGHRFECWVPLNDGDIHWVDIIATETGSNRAANRSVASYELRAAAKNGLQLTLAPPSRVVSVKVTDADKPVAGAHVTAGATGGVEPKATTDAQGIAEINLYEGSVLYSLTAWTDDFRIGGRSYDSHNRTAPEVDELTVTLSKCRDQVLRFVDEDGKPVAGVNFEIDVSTKPRVYDILGQCEHSYVTTNDAGEVLYKWAPDWSERHIRASCRSNERMVTDEREVIDNVLVLKTAKYRKSKGKRIAGRVTATGHDVGGLSVELLTFQSDLESNVDRVICYTNPDGTFVADVLPDATYQSYVLDETLAGPAVPLILFDSKTGIAQSPQLSVTEGIPVEVMVKTGPEEKPWANVSVYAKREEDFTWMEAGKTRRGSSGPARYTMTDETGRAKVRVHSGELTLSIRSPHWHEERSVKVVAGEPNRVVFHRRVDKPVKKTIRLVLPPGVESTLTNAEAQIVTEYPGYKDPASDEKKITIKCAADGVLSFTTALPEVVIYASTADGRAAGSFVVDTVRSPDELLLKPTFDYHGQLLTVGKQPLANHRVWATVSIKAREVPNERSPDPVEVKRVETTTDEQGNYTLSGIPLLTVVNVYAAGLQPGDENFDLASLYLDAGTPIKRLVRGLPYDAEVLPSKRPLAARLQRVVDETTLHRYRPLLIVGKEQPAIRDFAEKNLLNDSDNPDAYRFRSLLFFQTEEGYSAEDIAFCAKQGWELPRDGWLAAFAFDLDGRLIERADFEISSASAAIAAAEFLRRNALPEENSMERWNAAFAAARETNRHVWVRMGGKYCDPCYRLTKWIAAHRDVLEKDYVLLGFDGPADYNQVSQRLGYESGGIPFHGMLDPEERLVINSIGPQGNIGFPTDGYSKHVFKQMLLKTRKNLTDSEIDELVESIE